VAGEGKRASHRLDQSLRHRLDGAGLRQVREQDRELVTAESRNAVRCGCRSPGAICEPCGEVARSRTDAGRTPVAQRAGSLCAAGRPYRSRARTDAGAWRLPRSSWSPTWCPSVSLICLNRSRSMKSTPTAEPLVRARSSAAWNWSRRSGGWQAGQAIVVRQLPDLVLGLLAFGDVLDHAVHRLGPAGLVAIDFAFDLHHAHLSGRTGDAALEVHLAVARQRLAGTSSRCARVHPRRRATTRTSRLVRPLCGGSPAIAKTFLDSLTQRPRCPIPSCRAARCVVPWRGLARLSASSSRMREARIM